MRKKRFIGNQIVALIIAIVCLCCMLIPCLSLTIRWEETGETSEPLDAVMDLIIPQKEVAADAYVKGIGNDEAAGKWKDLSFWQLAKYTWDAGCFLGDAADTYKAEVKALDDIDDSSPIISEQRETAAFLAARSRFAGIVAFCVSVSIYGVMIGLVITMIVTIVKILLALFSDKMAEALAEDAVSEKAKKEGKSNPIGALVSGYGALLLCHHLFGFAMQNIYMEALSGGSDLWCKVDLVFSGGVHWLILIIVCGVMVPVGQLIVKKIFQDRLTRSEEEQA